MRQRNERGRQGARGEIERSGSATREKGLSLVILLMRQKALLGLLLGIHESIEKVEELLDIVSDENQDMDAPVTVKKAKEEEEKAVLDGKLIERVAIEYNQLLFLVSEGRDLPFVQKLEWRINRIKEVLTKSLTKSLEASFVALVEEPSNASAATSVSQFLRTYVLVCSGNV